MLKSAILCALGGIALVFIGGFEKSKTIQDLKTHQSKPCFFVQPNILNVREAPNLKAKVINKLQQNSQICEYFNTHNGFLHTKEGWIAARHLSLEPFRLEQMPDPMLAQAQKTIDTKDSKIQTSSEKIESHYAKNQRKSKFKLTSTEKDSTPVLASHQNNQNLVSPSFQNSIIQARREMDNQNYTRAKNLALRANLANPKNLESWEIFARSVYLEGNPQEAILILQNFLQQTYDENLANLLKLMQQGQKI